VRNGAANVDEGDGYMLIYGDIELDKLIDTHVETLPSSKLTERLNAQCEMVPQMSIKVRRLP